MEMFPRILQGITCQTCYCQQIWLKNIEKDSLHHYITSSLHFTYMASNGEQTSPPPKKTSIKFQQFSLEWIRPASANGRSLQFSAAAPGGCTPLKHSLSWNKQDAQGQQVLATTMAVFFFSETHIPFSSLSCFDWCKHTGLKASDLEESTPTPVIFDAKKRVKNRHLDHGMTKKIILVWGKCCNT